ncbi:hypothetical protein [Agromyces albus]|uniref:hypothetical protein n=1 Tax=Agromyces albus TaxID=205332 RepID=UPI0019D6F4D1|nr:hypothetical protein [Agromyces albus]
MLVDTRYCPIIPKGVEVTAVGPIVAAGVTVCKALKVTDTKPGDSMLISGIGGSRPLERTASVSTQRKHGELQT